MLCARRNTFSGLTAIYRYSCRNGATHLHLPHRRSISSTSQLNMSWIDKVKGVFTGDTDKKSVPTSTSTSSSSSSPIDKIKGVFTGEKKSSSEPTSTSISSIPSGSFTLLRFADELSRARKVGSFKQYIVGRSATFAESFEKQEAIIRYLGRFDSTGEKLLTSHKQEAAKHCSCTFADVEYTLAKFTWAKEAQRKMEKLKEEGKPIPKNLGEVQKMMGSTPLDVARTNLVKSGKTSRNAPCPCGSKKKYKRCCGKVEKSKATGLKN